MTTTITPLDAANVSEGTGGLIGLGKEMVFFSRAVIGGTLYTTICRGAGSVDPAGISTCFVSSTANGTNFGSLNLANAALTTVGAGTILAAMIGGGFVTRTGSTAAFTDTTDTAALINTLMVLAQNNGVLFRYINQTNATATIAGGTNVTMSGTQLVGPNSEGTFLLTRTDANTATPTFNMVGLQNNPIFVQPEIVATALATVGAGAITAAGLVGGQITRSGTQTAAFADTLPLASATITALPGTTAIGQSWLVEFVNNTIWPSTITTNTGWTVSGTVIVPAGCTGTFLCSVASGTTLTCQGMGVAPNLAPVPPVLFTTYTAATGTAGASILSGGELVVCTVSAQTAAVAITTRTAAQMVTDTPQLGYVGGPFATYVLRIINQNFLVTAPGAPVSLVAASGVTVSSPQSASTAFINQGCWADFQVTYSALSTMTMVQIAGGNLGQLQPAQYMSDATATTETFAAGVMTGAQFCNVRLSGGSSYTATTRTGIQMFADTPGAYLGMSWIVEFTNLNSGIVTLAVGTSVSAGTTTTLTLSANTTRRFVATFTTVSNVVLNCIGTGTFA